MTTLTSEDQARALVVQQAQREVGKHYGLVGGVPNPTPYGRWYGPGWERALFCAAGASWCWDQALGTDIARSIIGYQTHGGTAPNRRGFVWTVAMWEQHRAHRVSLRSLKPGDFLLFKYPTSGGRNTNVVNHVDLVEVNRPDLGYVDTIGFNVPRPGAPAGSDQSMGGGVWRRRIWYSNPYIVGGLTMPVASFVAANRAAWSRVQQAAQDLDLGTFGMTGVYGPATKAAVDTYAATYGYVGDRTDPYTLHAHMEDTMNQLDRIEAKIDKAQAGLAAIHSDVVKVPRNITIPTVKDIVDGIFTRKAYGFSFDWWTRRGLVTDPDHRNFPADPGSPAYKELVAEAAQHDGRATIWTADGLVRLQLEDGTFTQVTEEA